MEGKTKTARIGQKSTFLSFFVVFFLLKIQDIRKSKTPISERGSHKKFLVKCLPFFKLAPICKPFYNRSVNPKAFKYTIITLKLKIYFSWKSWKYNFVCKLLLHFPHTLQQFFLHKTHFLTGPGAGSCLLPSNRTSSGMAKLGPGLGTLLWAFINATWTTARRKDFWSPFGFVHNWCNRQQYTNPRLSAFRSSSSTTFCH